MQIPNGLKILSTHFSTMTTVVGRAAAYSVISVWVTRTDSSDYETNSSLTKQNTFNITHYSLSNPNWGGGECCKQGSTKNSLKKVNEGSIPSHVAKVLMAC